MAAHLLSIALPLTIFAIAMWNYSYFSWHPVCMSAAYAFLMNEAIRVFSKQSGLAGGKSKSTKINYHSYMLFTAMLLAFTGFYVIYSNKNAYGKKHFTTPHGLAGIFVLGYTAVQVPAGIFVRYASMFKLPKSLTLSDLKLYHGLSGCSLFILACLAMLGGVWSEWFTRVVPHKFVQYGCTLGILSLTAIIGLHAYRLFKSKRGSVSKK